jgi:hypothetical protein
MFRGNRLQNALTGINLIEERPILVTLPKETRVSGLE